MDSIIRSGSVQLQLDDLVTRGGGQRPLSECSEPRVPPSSSLTRPARGMDPACTFIFRDIQDLIHRLWEAHPVLVCDHPEEKKERNSTPTPQARSPSWQLSGYDSGDRKEMRREVCPKQGKGQLRASGVWQEL